MGPHQGRKAFMMQTLAPRLEERDAEAVAQANGFSLHASVAAQAGERAKLERLCRYISRPAVAVECLSLTAQGHIRSTKTSVSRTTSTERATSRICFIEAEPRVIDYEIPGHS